MSDTVDATDNIVTNNNVKTITPTYITAAPMPSDGTDRVFTRQLLSGNMRGNQNITGNLTINNASTNTTTITLSGTDESITITDPTTKLDRVLIGQLPDGTYGIAVSIPGQDVTKAFS